MEERDSFVKDYLATRDRLRQRFQNEALGETILQEDAAKLFKPIITETQKQISASTDQTKELRKVVDALAGTAAAAPRSQPMALEAPATAREEQQDPSTILVNPDKGLDIEIIRKYNFKPPSELNFSDLTTIYAIIEAISDTNIHQIGAKKRTKGISNSDKESLTRDQKALKAYRERLRLMLQGFQLAKPSTGSGLKLKGNRFGSLSIDPVALQAGSLRAFNEGGLVLEAPADETLYNLLTKRFVKAKQYTPEAVNTFRRLAELAGLPLHGRRSKKHQLLRSHVAGGGAAIKYYSDPEDLVKRLQLLVSSKLAGNTGLDNEISAILDELHSKGAVPKALILQLNRALL